MKKFNFLTIFLVLLFAVSVNAGVVIEQGTPVDTGTGAVPTISTEHLEVHEGDTYTVNFQNAVTTTGQMTAIGFNTPAAASGYVHVVFLAESSAASDFRVVEAPSVDASEGTETTPYNRNRNSANTSGVTSIETVPAAGEVTTYNETQAATANITETTVIYQESIGTAGNPVTSSGGLSRGTVEFVLAASTQYIFMLDATTTTAMDHNLVINWYEH